MRFPGVPVLPSAAQGVGVTAQYTLTIGRLRVSEEYGVGRGLASAGCDVLRVSNQ